MKTIKDYLVFFLSIAVLTLSNGCATLPNVTAMIDEAPAAQQSPQIVSSQGPVSPGKSKVIMERLENSVNPTDLLERHLAVVESVTKTPLTKGNHVTLLADGKATYAAMFKAIEKAKNHINLESYIIEDDETGRKFADLLLQKRAEGVLVNIIYDSVGGINTPASFFQRLRDGGIKVVEFNPINPINPLNPLKALGQGGFTRRDHRKILIVDGKVAIIGGVNISNVYSSGPYISKKNGKKPIHWRDTDVKIEGPSVAEFQKLFLATWLQQQGPILAERNYFPALKENGKALVRVVGSTTGQSNRIPFIVYVSTIAFAEHSIHLTNSYFIPDKQIMKALTDAAKRGVDVKIILPGINDFKLALYAQRSYYAELLQSGVKIYEHSSSLLHAKTAVIDNIWSTVGSTNLDYASLLNNDEVNAIVLSHEFAVEMEQMFNKDLEGSEQITWEEWQKSPFLPRVKGWIVDVLFSRWL